MSRIISIEGNIGSGKSTFVKMLKNYYKNSNNIIFLQEPVHIWENIKDKKGENIIEKFYKDNKKYAFSFQMMAYISRISQLKKVIKENKNKIIVSERSIFTDKNVFAKMLYDNNDIEEVNFEIYLKWFNEFIEDIPQIHYIYLDTT
jgi:deoxyadenosine/deoxycytidine kinase